MAERGWTTREAFGLVLAVCTFGVLFGVALIGVAALLDYQLRPCQESPNAD